MIFHDYKFWTTFYDTNANRRCLEFCLFVLRSVESIQTKSNEMFYSEVVDLTRRRWIGLYINKTCTEMKLFLFHTIPLMKLILENSHKKVYFDKTTWKPGRTGVRLATRLPRHENIRQNILELEMRVRALYCLFLFFYWSENGTASLLDRRVPI